VGAEEAMSRNVVEVGDAEFDREVLQAREPVLVDFTAAWCAPCKVIAPLLDQLAADQQGRLKVVSVDVEVAQATAERYGVRAMPTLLFFRGGQVVKQVVGAVPRRVLDEAAREVLGGAGAGSRAATGQLA
jgi:thioredoxin 1